MLVTCRWREKNYRVDLSNPISIAIQLHNNRDDQPNAFGAPFFKAEPVVEGDFTGAIAAGSPVDFYNVHINPHGNGTHTECIKHILAGEFTIVETLRESHLVAELISVLPTKRPGGDLVITAETLSMLCCEETEALVVRTMPNEDDKKTRKYTGTHPPYFEETAIEWLNQHGIRHLLTDLPSVDPEQDGGALRAHKRFWEVPENPQIDKTITEMVFVDKSVEDGLYLLNLQIAPLALDVSPSRPLLFTMQPVS